MIGNEGAFHMRHAMFGIDSASRAVRELAELPADRHIEDSHTAVDITS
jgi:hypothetical protein